MTPGFIYNTVFDSTPMVLPSSWEAMTETPVFMSAEVLRRDIINQLNMLNCDERLDFLRNYKIPTSILGISVIYVSDKTPVNFRLGFRPITDGDGYIYFRLHEAYTAPSLDDVTYWQRNRSIVHYMGELTNRAVDYDAGIRGLSVAFFGARRITPPGESDEFKTANVDVSVTVDKAINIDIDYFLSLFPECEYPPLPNPNNSPQAIVSPNDDINWREELRMSLPPAETKQPLANNTLPLNILRFLK